MLFYRFHFQSIKQSLPGPQKHGSIKKFKYWFSVCWYFDEYLFQLIVPLKPVFNCSSSLALSWVDKVAIGTSSFVSVITNFGFPVAKEITQSSNQIRIRVISQLIKRHFKNST